MARKRRSKPILQRGRWRIRWTDFSGKRRSEIYDNFDDAEFALRRHELGTEEIERGLRPPVRAPDKTLGDLFDYWLKKRAPRKRSGSDDESIIRAHLRPFFGKVLLSEFSTAHVDAFIEEKAGFDTLSWPRSDPQKWPHPGQPSSRLVLARPKAAGGKDDQGGAVRSYQKRAFC